MKTIGQSQAVAAKPRRKRVATPEQLEARENRRVERLRKSFERVTVKAKSDITKALLKGKPSYEIESRVPQREACFGQLRSRLKTLQEDARAATAVMPLWNEFVSWAEAEKLAIQLQPRGIGVSTDARWYVCIKAEPLRKTPERKPRPERSAPRWQ